MKKFLMFDVLISPWIIRVLYWILQIAIIVSGLILIFTDHGVGYENIRIFSFILLGPLAKFGGIGLIIVGSIYLRLLFELFLVLFKIFENSNQIKDLLKNKQTE